jgi:hypothetical protein
MEQVSKHKNPTKRRQIPAKLRGRTFRKTLDLRFSLQRENFKSINIRVEEFCLLGYNSTDVSWKHVASNFTVEE